MKTNNYRFDLMHHGLEYKDIIYNETVLNIDAMLNLSIIDFTSTVPTSLSCGEKFIIDSGTHINKICYFVHNSKGIQFFQPHENMLVYVIKAKSFYIFCNRNWQKQKTDANYSSSSTINLPIENVFNGISGNYILPKNRNFHNLFLNGPTSIDFDRPESPVVTLIIKQNHLQPYKIEWPGNILWKDKVGVTVTQVINSMDIYKFYKLPESSHFLAEIVSQNYQY